MLRLHKYFYYFILLHFLQRTCTEYPFFAKKKNKNVTQRKKSYFKNANFEKNVEPIKNIFQGFSMPFMCEQKKTLRVRKHKN